MRVTIPDVPYARVQARNIPSKEVGGDFFDVISTDKSLTIVVTDVSGKGISAAILASILQGLLYAQLAQDLPLSTVVGVVNRFLCEKVAGEKYATLVIARLHPDGLVEYVNCGHVTPLLISQNGCAEVEGGNLPVGLLKDVSYESGTVQMAPGARLVIVTDGVTEAEDPVGDMYGSDRLAKLLPDCGRIEDVIGSISKFCAGTPLNDDCTIVQLSYTGNNA
jgi:serine phosphatase RsbU (regulator of sigma subunit)